MLIATRFGLGVRDPDWFRHRVTLLSSITAASLLAQDDQNFEWVVFVDSGLPEDVRDALQRTFEPFNGRAYMDWSGHDAANLVTLVRNRELVNSDGYFLTGRIDDDDAWSTRTISTVRERIEIWRRRPLTRGLCVSFESGLLWIMYDMLDVHDLQTHGGEVMRHALLQPYLCPFTSISGFVYSSVQDEMTSISTSHGNLGKFLQEKNFAVDLVASDHPMWLYCRHKQTTSPIRRSADPDSLDISIRELSSRFGIDSAQVEHYIANSDSYTYSRIGHWERRSRIRAQLKDGQRRLADPSITDTEAKTLTAERKTLLRELESLSKKVTVDIDREMPTLKKG